MFVPIPSWLSNWPIYILSLEATLSSCRWGVAWAGCQAGEVTCKFGNSTTFKLVCSLWYQDNQTMSIDSTYSEWGEVVPGHNARVKMPLGQYASEHNAIVIIPGP